MIQTNHSPIIGGGRIGIGADTIIIGGWGGGNIPGGGGSGAIGVIGKGGWGGGGAGATEGAGTGGGGTATGAGGLGRGAVGGAGGADVGVIDDDDVVTGFGPIFSFSSSGKRPLTLWIWCICSSSVIFARAALVAASTLEVWPSHVTYINF